MGASTISVSRVVVSRLRSLIRISTNAVKSKPDPTSAHSISVLMDAFGLASSLTKKKEVGRYAFASISRRALVAST